MDPLAPRVAGDVADNARSTLRDVLPWPFSIIVDGFLGDRLEAVKVATRPNPYTTSPSGSQSTIAAYQARQNAIRGGFTGLAGSVEQWDTDQDAVTIARLGMVQPLSSQAIPPSRMLPYTLQGHPRDANTTRGYTGPVITPTRLPWGWSTRFRAPRILAGTLLPPESRSPTAREMASSYVSGNPSQLRLDDPYNAPDDMEDWG